MVLENVLISSSYIELFQMSQHHLLMRLSSPLYILPSFVLRQTDHKCMGLFLGFLSCVTDYVSDVFANTVLFSLL